MKPLQLLLVAVAAICVTAECEGLCNFMVPAKNSCSKWVTIKTGDTCWQIATNERITVEQLQTLNPGVRCDFLQIGARLCVSGSAEYNEPKETFKVRMPFLPMSGRNILREKMRDFEMATTPAKNSCSKWVTIKTGDTCWQIATNEGITVEQLQALNPGVRCDFLQIGAKLCVSGSAEYKELWETSGVQKPFLPIFGKNILRDFMVPAKNSCSKWVTIKSGDTCWQIATNEGITVEQLQALNPGVKCDFLQIGAKLCVSGSAEYKELWETSGVQKPFLPIFGKNILRDFMVPAKNSCSKWVTIKSGDTCWQIATNEGITVEQLQALNPGVKCDFLQIGAKLCVSGSAEYNEFKETFEVRKPFLPIFGRNILRDFMVPAKNSCSKWVTIKSGDTCWQIATNEGITVEQLQALNPGVRCDFLQIGARLCVSGSAEYKELWETSGVRKPFIPILGRNILRDFVVPAKNSCSKWVTIETGDTCWQIATNEGITVEQLQALNPGVRCEFLQIGARLCVSGSAEYKDLMETPEIQMPFLPTSEKKMRDFEMATTPARNSCSKWVTIKSGDTCWQFATNEGITVEQLQALNPGVRCDFLQIGARLCVSGSGEFNEPKETFEVGKPFLPMVEKKRLRELELNVLVI